MKRHHAGIFALLALHGAFAFPAMAELADRNATVNVSAREWEASQLNNTLELRGNVVLTQGTMRLVAERMVLIKDGAGIKSATAYGGPGGQVSFRQRREGSAEFMEGYADRVEFDDEKDTLELFARARLKDGPDEMRGEYIYYNSATEVLRARGSIPAGRAGAAERGGEGDATFTFQPRESRKKDTKPVEARK